MSDIFPPTPYKFVPPQIFSTLQNKSYLTGFFLMFMSLSTVILISFSEKKKNVRLNCYFLFFCKKKSEESISKLTINIF